MEHADRHGDVSKTCRYFGIGRASFYRWRKAFADKGDAGLLVARSVPHNHPNKMSPEVEEKILHLRRTYHLGPIRIVWYLERYHAIKVSDAGVYRTLKRHGLNRLPQFRMCYGHEFQARFHWHVADKGIGHVYIKPSSPQLNGKVERSHRSDQQEFYKLLSYKDDVDLAENLDDWERFYNFARPHGAFAGKTPYEALRERL